jgi:hypothetical protein
VPALLQVLIESHDSVAFLGRDSFQDRMHNSLDQENDECQRCTKDPDPEDLFAVVEADVFERCGLRKTFGGHEDAQVCASLQSVFVNS